MHQASLVSIVMPFLDAERFIGEAIASVFAQTHPHWELILVDDGSTDRSTAIARDLAARHPGKLRYLDHPGHRNRGTSASRNLGIAHARGDCIAFLDADDVYLPDRLERHVALLEAAPEVDMVQSDTLRWYSWSDPALEDVRGRSLCEPNTIVRAPVLLDLSLRDDPLRGCFPCICSVTVRRSAIARIHGFEEDFFDLCEDWVFLSKIYFHLNVLANDDVVARYRKHPESTLHRALSDKETLLGRRYEAHVSYLRWLRDYLERDGAAEPALLEAVRRKLWPEGAPLRSWVPLLPPAIGIAWRTGTRRIVRLLLSDAAYERQRRWRRSFGAARRRLVSGTRGGDATALPYMAGNAAELPPLWRRTGPR